MVLDGEKNEALRILLQEGLICFLRPDSRGNVRLLDFLYLLLGEVRNADDGLVAVLLVRRREINLLYW